MTRVESYGGDAIGLDRHSQNSPNTTLHFGQVNSDGLI